MKRLLIIFLIAQCSWATAFAQGIGIGTNTPDPSAQLDISSTNKGTLVTRMTSAQRKAIVTPATGLLVFDTNERTLYMYDGNRWMGFTPLPDNARPANNYTFPPANGDSIRFGYSVSIWDQFAVIGAPARKIGALEYAGSAFVYRKTGGNWQYFTTLTPTSGNVDNALFGVSVSIGGNSIVVGASNHLNGSNQRTGAVYIYNFNGTAWVNTQIIFSTTVGAGFGGATDINQYGTYMAVSETGATITGLTYAGVVKIYNFTAGAFALQQTLQDPSPVANESFGTSLALSPTGDYALIGAPYKTISGATNNGYVALFRRAGAAWSIFQSYSPPAAVNQMAGKSIDVTDQFALVAVPGNKVVIQFTIFPSSSWQGSFATITEPIGDVAIDPVTERCFIYAGNSIYDFVNPVVKLKSVISETTGAFPLQIFSVYGNDCVIGFPNDANNNFNLSGAAYLGIIL
jgi:FG-GAP repeat